MVSKRTEVRQQEIIEAVRNLITTKGMESVTIAAIAEAVGLTEGAIYRHFSSKHEILSLLIREIEQTLLSTVRQAQQEGASGLENLERILKAHLNTVERRRAVSFIVIAEAIAFEGIGLTGRVASMLAAYLDSIRTVLKKGMEDGSLRPDLDADAAAVAFFGVIQSTATVWALNDYAPFFKELGSHLWNIYKKGVAFSV